MSDICKEQMTVVLPEKTIILIGVSHTCLSCVEEVKQAIDTFAPNCVAVELDQERLDTLEHPEAYEQKAFASILFHNEGLMLLANLVLSSIQRKECNKNNTSQGLEMLEAIRLCQKKNIPTVLVDRPIQITLARAWYKSNAYEKYTLLSTMLQQVFSKEEASVKDKEAQEDLPQMDIMLDELSSVLPRVKEALIDERDTYIADKILHSTQSKVVLAILGKSHLQGVKKNIEDMASAKKDFDIESLVSLPKKSIAHKVVVVAIPVLLVALVVAGFIVGGKQMGSKMVGDWVLWNALLAMLGASLALPHPLTVIVAAIGAPFTSLCPFVGVGMVAGLVQAVVAKPRVRDIQNITLDISSIKGIYRNRMLKVLAVFILSSIGSSIGTFLAGASFVAAISTVFNKILSLFGL